jgi:hypothetical protein
MLSSRVKTGVVRLGASEVLLGVRRQFAGMGIELSGDMDDEIALATARYTPDELGVETDEEGVPARNAVTLSPPVEKPDPVQKFARESSAEEIAGWAEVTAADSSLSREEKLERFQAVHSACGEAGRLGSPLNIQDPDDSSRTKATSLNAVLMSCVKPLLPNS